MTYQEHFKKNLVLALPVMTSQVGHMMVSLADSVMVGRLGTIPLASVSLASGVYSVFLLFGIGVSYGMTPMVAKADGASDVLFSAKVLKNGLILNLLTGVALAGLSWLATLVFPLMDQEPEVLEGAVPFFLILGISTIPLMIFQSFRQFTEGLSLTRQAMVLSLLGNVLNIILNYLLIYGAFGFPELGLLGAAWSTLISRSVMAIAMGSYVFFHTRFSSYRSAFGLIKIDWAVLRQILAVGLPSGIQFVFEVGAFSAAAVMTGWIGAEALAAHQIVLNLSAITYMAATGLAAAATIRIGNQLGKKDYVTMKMAGYTSFITVAILMSLLAVNFIVGRHFYPTIYIEDISVVAMAAELLVIAAFFQVSDGVQAVGLGVLRGLSDVKVPTILTLISYWGLAIPVSYLLGIILKFGLKGIWIGLLIGLTVAAISHLIRFRAVCKRRYTL